MIRYRHSLCIGFLFKSLISLSNSLFPSKIPNDYLSAIEADEEDEFKSHQFFQVGKSDSSIYNPVKHRSADTQASGEAIYVDDMPHYENELHVGWVLSSKAHAKIISVELPNENCGIVDFLSAKDLSKERNSFAGDERVFAEDEVHCVGQVIGIVLVDGTLDDARRAASKVKVVYQDLDHILTIQDAMEAQSFYPWPKDTIIHGNAEKVMDEEKDLIIISGKCSSGAQDHFYLEMHSCMVVPNDSNGEIDVYSSTQNPSGVQNLVSHVTGIPAHKIHSHNKRIGGGFGGKQRSMPFTLPVAIAAVKHNKPVRMMLDRDQDMMMTGQRHPFYAEYKIGVRPSGMITAVVLDLYNNAGWTLELSAAVIGKSNVSHR